MRDYATVAGGCIGALFLMAVAVLALFGVTCAFEYNLYSITGHEVPWFLDLLGAIIFNGVNILVFTICVIARACGYEAPFYDLVGQ